MADERKTRTGKDTPPKNSKFSAPLTGEARKKAVERLFKTLDKMSEEARKKGLTEDVMEEILEEIKEDRIQEKTKTA
ncbi:MAG: hypothetical protein EA357_08555 [Micavibrio sp.]|nr:MAG: hypothetical protein EA357_08555 [Micavibrio sp.]